MLAGNSSRSPVFKKFFKYIYIYTTHRLKSTDVTFLNNGYEEDPPMALPLNESDEPNRFGIQLYHRTATQIDLGGKEVLEVSCGHGGGAAYLVRKLHPASYTALDFNSAGVALCRQKHRLPGLTFVKGDAQKLPFPDRSFDALINIEASHHYPNFEGFLSEVVRVLRPGGHFLYADLRRRQLIPAWEAALAAVPLRLVSERIINDEVLRGIRCNSPRLNKLIDDHVPAPLAQFYRDFAVLDGSRSYRNLERGDTTYRIYCFAKD